MKYNLEIKKSYDITLLAPSILSIGYKSATIMAFMDYDTAKSISDVTSKHAMVYNQLPVGTPRDPADLLYIKLKLTSNVIVVIAEDWIANTPVMVSGNSITVKINSVGVTDIPVVRDILIQNGYSNFEINLS